MKKRNVILWDVANRRRIAMLPGKTGDTSLSFSPDGRRLAIATDGPQGTIVLWDVASRPPVAPWVTGGGYWEDPTFSPDGRWLAIHSTGGIDLWDVPERRLMTTLPRHGQRAVFSPDSRLLAASVDTAEVAIWDVGTRTLVRRLDVGGEGGGEALLFSPDSQVLTTTGQDGVTLQRFDASWAAQHLCQIVHRDMTREEWNDYVPGRAYQKVCT